MSVRARPRYRAVANISGKQGIPAYSPKPGSYPCHVVGSCIKRVTRLRSDFPVMLAAKIVPYIRMALSGILDNPLFVYIPFDPTSGSQDQWHSVDC